MHQIAYLDSTISFSYTLNNTTGVLDISSDTIPYYDMGIYDKNGTVIIDPKYRTWQRIGNSFNSNWGSSYNNVSVETPSFSDGKIKAQNADGKWGFINLEGKLVGQVRWDKIGGFSEGMAAVLENGMYGYIASNGVVLIEPQYMAADVFSEGQAWVKTSDGLWQCIDKSNQVIIEAKYSSVTKFKNGLADVLLPDVGWQIIDAQGNMVYFKTNEIILSYDETNTPAPSYTEGDIELAQEVTDIPKTTEAPVMPVGQIINRYGITNKNANFRKGPSTGDGKYGELLAGTYVYLIYTETGTDGELWTLVDTAGQRGYLMSKFINVLTQEDSDAYNYAQPTPAPVYTLEDIFPPAAQTMETLAPEMPMNTMINRYGRTDMNVNFRSEASTNSKSKGNLKKNTLVWLIYTSENDFGELWTYVMVNGETGYIKTEYLSLLAAEDSAALDSAQSTPAPVYTVDDIFQTVETY